MPLKKIGQLILAIVVCEFTGIIGSVFTIRAIPDWYGALQKPAGNPPSWVFGPVWTLLYALMGLSAFLVYQKGWKRKEVKGALGIFGAQLLLNALWSILFFGLHQPGIAFLDIVLLWISILVTMFVFGKISKAAAWLLLPYLVWVSYASYLNLAIAMLN